MTRALPVILGGISSIGLALVQAGAEVPVTVVPTINLVAIIAGSISMGMLFNRVRQLEKRLDEEIRKPWDGVERRTRPARRK